MGGGLTAGHLAVRGAKQVAAAFPDGGKVTLCARSEIRQRQFDLALPWMGRERAHMLCHHFWAHSASERLEILRGSKNGGSITPEVLRVLDGFEKRGIFERRERTEVESVAWQEAEEEEEERRGGGGGGNGGNGAYEASLSARNGSWLVTFSSGETEEFDAIWCATGTVLDARRDPLLRGAVECADARADLPDAVLLEDRLPVLDGDCRLVPGLDLFVMGEYAAVQLGPGAVNLMGGRAGAARVARAVKRMRPDLGLCEYADERGRCGCREHVEAAKVEGGGEGADAESPGSSRAKSLIDRPGGGRRRRGGPGGGPGGRPGGGGGASRRTRMRNGGGGKPGHAREQRAASR